MAEQHAESPRPRSKSRQRLHDLRESLEERRERFRERPRLYRYGTVAFGFLLVLAGIALSGPGVPGPGFLVIAIGLGFLALQFTWAEKLLHKTIDAAERSLEKAEQTTPRQRILTGLAAALAVAAFVVTAILWDIPLLPV